MSKTASFRAFAGIALVGAMALGITACSGGSSAESTGAAGSDGELTTIGFVAVGPEGGWRTANEQNIQDSFSKENGFDLKYAPATNGDQNSQITAFTSFIDEGVDAILLSATEATGWESVLERAQEAEIPVVLLDRGIEPNDTSLYTSHIAPDNVGISASAAEWANAQFPDGANYVVLEGPPGLSVVNDRNKGWDETIDANMKKLESQSANWSTEEAKSVFETILKANNNDVQLVFAQNDEMGLGAALAVEEAGLKPGTDVKIITIDGTKAALTALSEGRLSFVAEYNPLFGDTAIDVVKSALAGETVESDIVVPSVTFDSPEAATEALPTRQF
ncbi:ABC transporter substrate-binding protein [Herbiconiux sp.]|jgi:ABC-type sugar transport system substrate-binding protein|uniref:ABC transporter substrate-binding protein n=1 Tax=Herbiconiux sp. TaxID=1871186 RepID=UPI0025BB89DB|nr:ABC transporter substrate-binding protein [Herbiconiux sp.]